MPAARISASRRSRRTIARGMLRSSIALLRRALMCGVVSVIPARRLARHISLGDIVGDLVAGAQARVAPAAATGGAEDEAITRLHRHARGLEELLLAAIASLEHGLVDGSGLAA